MATSLERAGQAATREERFLARGSIVEVLTGGGAIVLPILALLGVLPLSFAAIAFVAIGAGLMMQGGELRALRSYGERGEVAGGMSADIVGGAVVGALGVLSLFRLMPMTLLPLAAIVAGASLVLGAGASARLARPRPGSLATDEANRQFLRESVGAPVNGDVLVGLAAVTLGILVIGGIGPGPLHLRLVLVAALALGAGLFLNGTAVGERMPATPRR
jgi:hypothetical protein